jgi:PAS domain S-box-containing protein
MGHEDPAYKTLKQDIAALQKSKDLFHAIFEGSRDAIFITDDNKQFAYVNQAACVLTGYSKQELLSMTIPDLHFPRDIKTFERFFNGILNGKASISEADIIRKDGARVPTEFSSTVVTISGKKFMHTTARDVSTRKQAEAILKESETRYKLLSDATFEAIFISENGICISQNNTAERMFGYTETEASGRMATDWIHPDDREQVKKNMLSGCEDPYEVKALRRDGSAFHCSIQGRNYTHKGKNLRITALRDISDKKQAEAERDQYQAQLVQTQKMEAIGALAGGIAHDFNNILFPIIGHTQMLLNDTPEDGPMRNSLSAVYTSAMRAKGLVEQILTFSRQEKTEPRLMKIQPIVKEIIKLLRSTIPTTISIKQEISSGPGPIKADPVQIHQLVMNLATNGYHAMEENGGVLMFGLKAVTLDESDTGFFDLVPGDYVCLIVSDTGSGMDKALTKKIFDPFFTTKETGTGMGLSVVHGIVTGMKGTIQVYSEPGKGTRFCVYLPLEKGPPAEEVIAPEVSIPMGSERILLVDDDASIIDMEKMMLERLGYRVAHRTSSIEALEAFRVDPLKYDLVISDMAMPKLPGDKLAVQLLQLRPDIPILLCTGFSQKMTEEKIQALGVRGLLMKPVLMMDLAQKIREVLETPQSNNSRKPK